MKNLLKLSLILIPLFTLGQNQQDSLEIRINGLKQKSLENTLSKTENQELLKYGHAMQGRGMMLVMNEQKYEKALLPIDSAISYWQSINKIAKEANLLKYRCYIYGQLRRFDEAKLDFKQAVKLYTKAGSEFGVAVSQFDMARVYELENKLDSALYYQLKATKFWTEKNVTDRIIWNKTFLFHIYNRMDSLVKAVEIQKSMAALVTDETIWQISLDFYYVSYQLFKNTENKKQSKKYKQLYDNKIKQIRKDGIKAVSKYIRE